MLKSISKFAVILYVYFKLKSLNELDKITKKENIIVINKRDLETSVTPKKVRIFPAKGIEATSFFKEIIDMKGIIAAIEKDSNIPFNIKNIIKKENWIFLLELRKNNILNNGLFLIDNIIQKPL